MVYWATRWVDDDNPYFLGLSVLTWALGMYVFLEIAPAIFAIPVVWLLSQSSVRIAPLAAAVLVAALAWFPYLRFETSRHLVDVRSQVLRVALWTADYKQSWCDPGVAPAGWLGDDESANEAIDRGTRESTSTQPPSKVRLIVEELLLANFRTSRFPGIPAAAILLLAVAGTLVLFMARGTPLASRGNTDGVTRVVIGLAIASMLGALIFNEALAARYLSPDATLVASTVQAIRLLQAALLAAGLLFVVYRRVIAGAVIRVHQWMSSRATKTWPLAVSLVVSLARIAFPFGKRSPVPVVVADAGDRSRCGRDPRPQTDRRVAVRPACIAGARRNRCDQLRDALASAVMGPRWLGRARGDRGPVGRSPCRPGERR